MKKTNRLSNELNEFINDNGFRNNIKIFYAENAQKKHQIVVAKTILADESSKEILELILEPELI